MFWIYPTWLFASVIWKMSVSPAGAATCHVVDPPERPLSVASGVSPTYIPPTAINSCTGSTTPVHCTVAVPHWTTPLGVTVMLLTDACQREFYGSWEQTD